MKLKIILLIIALNIYNINCFAKEWNDLRITWGLNPFSSKNFESLPKTVTQAKEKGWKLEKACGQVNGNRYILNGDYSAILIFNSVGQISGIATRIPKGLPFNYPSQKLQKLLTNEDDGYFLSAYFRDPNTICSTSSLSNQLIGDRLVVKGTNYELSAPLQQSNISNFWTQGKCLPTQGLHYWGDIDGLPVNENTSSDTLLPLLLLFNRGKLNAISIVSNAIINGTRYNYPPKILYDLVFKSTPKYLRDSTKSKGVTSLLVFFDNTPLLNWC